MTSSKRLWLIYLGGFLMAVHFASVSYVNSSLLQKYVGGSALNVLYMAGSLLSIFFLFLAPTLSKKYGSIVAFLIFIAVETVAVLSMGLFGAAVPVIMFFLLHIAAGSALYFCLDLSLEQETKVEGTTGRKRGLLLFFSNLAWVLTPLAVALLVRGNDFSNLYLLSGFILIPLFIIVGTFFQSTKQTRAHESLQAALGSLRKVKDEAKIIGSQLMLNFFFAWMVIYLPLLLNRTVGFGWDKIGILFTIMLLPFLIFQIPAGILSDKKIGEKELLTAGFIIMAISTFAIPLISGPTFWLWALVLFATRIGASLVEVASESYFFKHVKEEDSGLISLFRMARPLSYVLAPLVAIPVTYFFSYSASFYFLSFFALLGLFFIPKVDTK